MLRALFEKTGNAIYISHLDLMRVFQRAFKRAGLPLTHSQGYNPRPTVSIALPLSLGTESICELLDFDLDGEPVTEEEILDRLNQALIDGVKVRSIYRDGQKLKNLAYLDCKLTLEYDEGVPVNSISKINRLFSAPELYVEKKSKNGISEQNIIPMIKRIYAEQTSDQEISLRALLCCQNPSLNPSQLTAAICKYLPELTPSFSHCRRLEIYDTNENVFR